MPKIFSIIVTYNGSKWIQRCMQHLAESDIKTGIIIIDNASTDNTLELLKPYSDTFHLIKSDVNRGFGQANNIGIKYAMEHGADFIFLLNQDAYVFKNTIGLLIEALTSRPDFGILSPLQMEVSGKNIEPIFKHFLSRNFDESAIKNMLTGENNFDITIPYAMRFVNAAAWMITRECIQKTGLFHPVFFHYGEDNHYASRVQFHDLKIGVLPAAHVIHDSKPEIKNDHFLLIRKMKTVPLYTLLDLRKSLPAAYLLGYLKWKSTAKKLSRNNDTATKEIIKEQKKWFSQRLSDAIKIRKETRSNYGI